MRRLPQVGLVLVFLISITGISPASASSCETGGVCELGDKGPGGGVVFFVKASYANTSISTQNGALTTSLTSGELAALPFDYLEAAPIGWDASSATDPQWNYNNSNNSGYSTITKDKIGTGLENTALMRSLNPTDTANNNIAYKLAQTSIGGFSDWWLPSNQELILMFTNLYKASPRLGEWSTASNLAYRTSTEAMLLVFRWTQPYEGNNVQFDASNWPYTVKPVRGFTARVASPGASDNSAALARTAELKRGELRRLARSEIISAAVSTLPLTADKFAQADITGVTLSNISDVLTEISKLPVEKRSDIAEILQIARKYEVVGMIASNDVIYPKMLQEIGLISSDNKTTITNALRKIPQEQKSNLTLIKIAIDVENKIIQERKARLEVLRSRRIVN